MKDKKKLSKVLRFIPAIVIMILIFAFSCKQGDESSEQSGRLLMAIVKVVESISKSEMSAALLAFLHLFIRKVAHFTEYAALGAAFFYGVGPLLESVKKGIPISIIMAAVYATTDEIHQYFVPGRYGTWTDVLIDSCGALAGIVIFYFVVYSHHGEH